MCSPKVAEIVRETLKREGKPDLSRRNFLRMGGVTAAGLAVAAAPKIARAARQDMTMGEIVDLSHVTSPASPVFPGDPAPERIVHRSIEENGYYGNVWTLWEHTATHCDIPAHFVDGGETVDQYAISNYVGPAVVVDISERAASEPDTELTPDDLAAWEAENGEIPAGAIVFMNSGWDARFGDPEAHLNMDEGGVMRFPGFHPDAAAWLLEERDVKGIGVDTLSLDHGSSTTFGTHVTWLGAGKFGIENVANLSAIQGMGATVIVGLPRLEQGSGGWARVMGILPAM